MPKRRLADKPAGKPSLKEKLEAYKAKAAGMEKQEPHKSKGGGKLIQKIHKNFVALALTLGVEP